MAPTARTSERKARALRAMSASTQAGACGNRCRSVRDGANSGAWPGASRKIYQVPGCIADTDDLIPRPGDHDSQGFRDAELM